MKQRKNDLLLIGGLLMGALILFLFISLQQKNRDQGNLKVVIRAGESGVISCDLFTDQEIPLSNILEGSDENLVVIRDGYAYMKEANCPDRLCIKQGRIHNPGEMILCLPHKVMITIVSEDEGPDALSW